MAGCNKVAHMNETASDPDPISWAVARLLFMAPALIAAQQSMAGSGAGIREG
jgi:hypothetical protein